MLLAALGVGWLLAADPETEERLAALEAEVARLKSQQQRTAEKVAAGSSHLTFLDELKVRLTGYTDIGLFKAAGDGVAYTRDFGGRMFPGESAPWVFWGDPWSNMINSQGDSADLGLDRTDIARFDPIASRGHLSFIINTVNMGFVATLGSRALFEVMLDFMPRQGTLGSPGDLFDLPLAYLEWTPFDAYDLHIFVGKFESVFGIEYRTRTAPDRPGITPSLSARYTTGTPLGVKVRGSVLDKTLTLAVSITNGTPFTEKFGHFFDELDSNSMKTLTGRLSYRLPTDLFFFEAGFSGMVGAQDLQPDNGLIGWMVAADGKLMIRDFMLRGEYVHVFMPGGGPVEGDELRADAWWLEASYPVFTWLTPVLRYDTRRAKLFTWPNLYYSNVGRVTIGLRLDITFNLVLKLEYLRILEMNGPDIDDDVFTSSLVLRF